MCAPQVPWLRRGGQENASPAPELLKVSHGPRRPHARPRPPRPCLGATSRPTAYAPEANGWVPDLSASAAKTEQVRRPPSRGVETLPKSELRPDLTLELEDALGLAGVAGDPGAQRLTRAASPSPPLPTPPL